MNSSCSRLECPIDGDHDLATAGGVSVLTQPDALPGAQTEAALGDGQTEAGADEAGFHVRRHVIRALAGVSKGQILGHKGGEEHLHVLAHVRVPVFIQRQTGRGVHDVQMADAHLKLANLGNLLEHLIGDQVTASMYRPEVDTPLEPPRARANYTARSCGRG